MPRKEGKEKKKWAFKTYFGAQGPEERECRRESESPGPTDTFASDHQVLSF